MQGNELCAYEAWTAWTRCDAMSLICRYWLQVSSSRTYHSHAYTKPRRDSPRQIRMNWKIKLLPTGVRTLDLTLVSVSVWTVSAGNLVYYVLQICWMTLISRDGNLVKVYITEVPRPWSMLLLRFSKMGSFRSHCRICHKIMFRKLLPSWSSGIRVHTYICTAILTPLTKRNSQA